MTHQAEFEDSNITKLGSFEDHQARIAAAKHGKEWEGAGQEAGIEVWRIKQFQLVKVPQKMHGRFYGGDCYIVLRTQKHADKFNWDVHFWLGKKSSQDERGTAAYKTVELDDLLGGAPIQHREVQGHESALFLSYWNPAMHVLDGGFESGFHKAEHKIYDICLLRVRQNGNRVVIFEVPANHKSLNTNDCFVLDVGLKLFIWEGAKSQHTERFKARTIAEGIQGERGEKPAVISLTEADDDTDFWGALGGKGPVNTENVAPENSGRASNDFKLFRVTDRSSTITMKLEHTGLLKREFFDTNDVFIIDAPGHLVVWVGKGASHSEKANAMKFAMEYIEKSEIDKTTPVTRVLEGQETPQMKAALSH